LLTQTTACPIKKGHYIIRGFSISDKDVPEQIAIPNGQFKIELNGTLHGHDKDVPIFTCDIFFKEIA
jgi:hypothetical protein